MKFKIWTSFVIGSIKVGVSIGSNFMWSLHTVINQWRPEGTNENTALLNVKLWYSTLKWLIHDVNHPALDSFGKNTCSQTNIWTKMVDILDHNARKVEWKPNGMNESIRKSMILNAYYLPPTIHFLNSVRKACCLPSLDKQILNYLSV